MIIDTRDRPTCDLEQAAHELRLLDGDVAVGALDDGGAVLGWLAAVVEHCSRLASSRVPAPLCPGLAGWILTRWWRVCVELSFFLKKKSLCGTGNNGFIMVEIDEWRRWAWAKVGFTF